MGNEIFSHDVYTKDELHTYCSCAVLFVKTAPAKSCECCDNIFYHGLRFYFVESIHANIELSCNCMEFIKKKLVVLLNKKSWAVFLKKILIFNPLYLPM